MSARPLIENQVEERLGGSREWVNVSERIGYRVLIVSDSLSMQIARITGNALALATTNCHSNNKGRLPLSREAN